jgi:uncharacterized repeat protein (TIGR04076 family)
MSAHELALYMANGARRTLEAGVTTVRCVAERDWLEHDAEVCCPDPEERLIMRIERIGKRRLRTSDLT